MKPLERPKISVFSFVALSRNGGGGGGGGFKVGQSYM